MIQLQLFHDVSAAVVTLVVIGRFKVTDKADTQKT